MKRLLLTTLTALLLTGLAHAAAPPPQWLPQDSWPGGRQYDARLEKTVTFWGTGVPAADLFAAVTKQTGVALGFSPPDDDNARLCLNIYLNPKEPPTLRDLLVQVGWVMDCAWAVEGEGEARRYVLLHTSIGGGALARMQRDAQQTWQAARQAEEVQKQVGKELQTRVMAELQEARGALALSRDDAIRKYRGRDDLLLLALLDPPRRALLRFVLTLPESALAQMQAGESWRADWEQLTAEQRELLREAMRPCVEERARREYPDNPSQEHWADWNAVQSLGLHVWVGLPDVWGGVSCGANYTIDGPEGTIGKGIEAPYLHLASDPRLEDTQSLGLTSEVQLRRALGEEVSEEQRLQRLEQLHRQQQRDHERQIAESRLAALQPLSSPDAVLLSSLSLPVKAEQSYALWQLQELVAATSGLHVISDCFVQLPLSLQEAIDVLHPEGPPDLSAYQVLRLACANWDSPEVLTYGWGTPSWLGSLAEACPPPRAEDWEWGDAGRFLRFRSRNRDLWRAALLPVQRLTTLHAWLEPFLPKDAPKEGPLPMVEVPLNPQACGTLLIGLTDTQRRFGGLVSCADPADWREAYRGVLRWAVLDVGWRNLEFYSLLARLTADQFARLSTDGLVWDVDVSVRGVPAEVAGWLATEPKKGDTMRLREIGPDLLRDHPMGDGTAESDTTSAYEVHIAPATGGGIASHLLPRNLLLRPQRLRHLVPPPQGAMPPPPVVQSLPVVGKGWCRSRRDQPSGNGTPRAGLLTPSGRSCSGPRLGTLRAPSAAPRLPPPQGMSLPPAGWGGSPASGTNSILFGPAGAVAHGGGLLLSRDRSGTRVPHSLCCQTTGDTRNAIG